jgi:uncharacterized protein YndB with AHSA1/START domain
VENHQLFSEDFSWVAGDPEHHATQRLRFRVGCATLGLQIDRHHERSHPVPETAADLDPLDRIDRSIDIDAPAERVWDLVVRPGWWINEGAVDPEPEIRTEGDTTVLVHPTYGEFRLRTVESRPPSYVAYHWLDLGVDQPTLVEFRIEPRPGGGVTLSVTESGFSRLGKSREEWLQHREGNDEGWRDELAAAKTYVEGA